VDGTSRVLWELKLPYMGEGSLEGEPTNDCDVLVAEGLWMKDYDEEWQDGAWTVLLLCRRRLLPGRPLSA
jgi:hypothetical protein